MKTEHTPEPWISEGSFIGIPNGKGTFYMSPLSGINQERRESDARRIVACVNACAGIPNEVLTTVGAFGGFGRDDMVQHITKQRDELLAALTLIATGEEVNGCIPSLGWAVDIAAGALSIPTDSTQILDEVRRAERERCAQMFEESGIGGDHLAAAIRAME